MIKPLLLWVLICAAYIIYKLWVEPKIISEHKKRKWDIVIVILVLPLLSYLMPKFLSDDAQREESFRKQALVALNDKSIEIENYKSRLIEIHKNEFQSSTADAEKWADNFIATLPIKRDKKKELEQEKQREIEKEKIKLPILFEFIVSTFDSKISALGKRIQGVKVNGVSNYDLFHNPSSGDKKDIVIRKIVYENENSIELILSQGSLGKGEIKLYPEIICREISKYTIDNPIQFKIWKEEGHSLRIGPKPLISDIGFDLIEGTFLNQGLKTRISEAFQQALETAYLR